MKDRNNETGKTEHLKSAHEAPGGKHLTTNQGVPISDNDNSLRAGARGPTLMEDFIFREKLTHFDHERIPERIVHARGSAAHGFFQPYESMAQFTRAKFLSDPQKKTPVFVRFSTVAGSRGSSDTVRDARGFATKFYTEEGTFDLVGNNMPVFFIQDAIKFPDLVHSVKPEPDSEMPQAAAAHDTFWDFISLTPESMHMIMWVLSDRAIPRSYRMMEGFGIHTFRFVNAEGKSHFVKFHWKPLLGMHSQVWDEAQKIAGKDPDYHRRDLWEAIEMGDYPEFEFAVQMLPQEDEFKFDFDLLDPTKIWPEEIVPVRKLGKMVLNRNPEYFFGETEQAAFHPGHVVPGIDFTNDPLLQGRLFSYLDTQLIRIGPNFAELPINRPLAEVHNNQRDGHMRYTINPGKVSYAPSSIGPGCPVAHTEGFRSYAEKIDGQKVRQRSESFSDHFSQAALFWNSQSDVEKQHLVSAAHFELGNVKNVEIRNRMVGLFAKVDPELGKRVAEGIGVPAPQAGGKPASDKKSPALSMANTVKNTVKSRRIAILAGPGYDNGALTQIRTALQEAGAHTYLVSRTLGKLKSASGQEADVDKTFATTSPVLHDAVIVLGGGKGQDALRENWDALFFVSEAYKHYKAVGAIGEGVDVLVEARLPNVPASGNAHGVVTARGANDADTFVKAFIDAVAQHRHWDRQTAVIKARG